MTTIRVCLAGATGWAGSALAIGAAHTADLEIVAAVSRRHAGKTLGLVLDEPRLAAPIFSTAESALATPCDVFVEYTAPDIAKGNILLALERGCHVVVGTSGLTEADYAEIDLMAKERRLGVLACGNFALTVVLLQRFARMAAQLIPQWEIIDYSGDQKVDAPSGTARELAFLLSQVGQPGLTVPLDAMTGPRESRGATVSGTQIHSIRLPSYGLATEVILGMADQKLVLRAEASDSARPYVDGALLAIRRVAALAGVYRGLDAVLDH